MSDDREMRERAFEFAVKSGFARPISKDLTDAMLAFAAAERDAANDKWSALCSVLGLDPWNTEAKDIVALRDAETERCCRDVCVYCRNESGIRQPAEVINGEWEHRSKKHSNMTVPCQAAAIRSRVAANESGASPAEGTEWIMGHMNELICSDRSCCVRKPGPHRSSCKFSPAEGPRLEIGRLYCDLTSAISHLLGLIESKGLEGWQIGFAKQVVRNVEMQYFGYPLEAAAQPVPGAKVEEIARRIVQAIYEKPCSTPTPTVEAILRPYFPADAPCPDCKGQGRTATGSPQVPWRLCPTCKATGKISRDRAWIKRRAEGEDKHIVAAGLAGEATEGPRKLSEMNDYCDECPDNAQCLAAGICRASVPAPSSGPEGAAPPAMNAEELECAYRKELLDNPDAATSKYLGLRAEILARLRTAAEVRDLESVVLTQRAELWKIRERAEAAKAAFKNFHRALCARFGYFHDEKDWQRDQVSLEEHIAAQLKTAQDALRKYGHHTMIGCSLGNCICGFEAALSGTAQSSPECDCGAGPHLKSCNLGLYRRETKEKPE